MRRLHEHLTVLSSMEQFRADVIFIFILAVLLTSLSSISFIYRSGRDIEFSIKFRSLNTQLMRRKKIFILCKLYFEGRKGIRRKGIYIALFTLYKCNLFLCRKHNNCEQGNEDTKKI